MVASFIPSILDELDDVQITSPASGRVIRHDGTRWVDAVLVHSDLSGAGALSHATIDSYLNQSVQTSASPAFAGLDISATAPAITLTDTTASAKSLKIDVDGDIAQIREKAGAANPLMSFNLANNRIGFFQAPSASALVVLGRQFTSSDPTTFCYFEPAASPNASLTTLRGIARVESGISPDVTALSFAVWAYNTGSITTAKGVSLSVWTATSITNAHLLNIDNPGSISLTNFIGIRIARDTGTRTRKYGFYYGGDAVGSEPAGFYAIYADTDNSYFGAKVGLGVTPTAVLHLKAGTASANTAPLKLTAGTNLTTPENGAFEYDGTNLYFTTGGIRKTVSLV